MTTQEFMKELDLWMSERNLTKDGQQEGLVKNILEELGELHLAIKEKDIEGQIDALLDVVVFIINAHELDTGYMNLDINLTMTEDKDLLLRAIIYDIGSILINNITPEEGIEYLINNVLAYIHHSGYDFDLCLGELMKGLHSRKGKWDESQKKFIKDNTADIYLPDYSKCKRINNEFIKQSRSANL